MSGSLPFKWTVATLDTLCVSLTDGDHQAPPKAKHGIPFITISAMNDGTLRLNKATRFVPKSYYDTLANERRAVSGDILFSVTGSVGIAASVNTDDRFVFQRHIAIIRPDSRIVDRDLLLHFLRHPAARTKLFAGATGTAQLTIPLRALRALAVLLPPLPEQRRIVAKLGSLSAQTKTARDELARIPLLLEHYKYAILKKAFSGELTAGWRERDTASSPVLPRPPMAMKKKYRSNDEGLFSPPYVIPNNWRWLRLPELGELDRGKSKHRPRNDPTLYDGDFPFVQTGEVREADRYLSVYSRTYNNRGLAQSRLWPKNTLCITIAANIAETAILAIEACFPDSVVGFIADSERISSSYVEFFLRTMKADLEAFAPATAQKNINLETLSSVRVPVPPLNEQAEIVRRIEAAMEWLNVVAGEQRQAAHLLTRLDQGLLAKAFRGELVPQDPNDLSAEKLLEGIRIARCVGHATGRGRSYEAIAQGQE